MNCETYQTLLMDDPAGASADGFGARDHAEACAACAAFTREQQRLLSTLRRMREEDASHAPEALHEAADQRVRVEKNLLSAFRALSVAAQPGSLPKLSSVGDSPSAEDRPSERGVFSTLPPAPQNLSGTRFPKWGALAAAVIFSLGVLLWISQQPRVTNLPTPPRVSRLPQLPQDWSVLSARSGLPTTAGGDKSASAGTERTVLSAKTLSVDNVESTETFASSEGRAPSPAGAAKDEFIQLVPRTPGFLDDGPVVMRVRMPYAAAEYLGAPAGVASHGQPPGSGFVQADLLVGSDGTTRAIRFVQ